MLVVGVREKRLSRGGVRVVVMARRVAVGKASGGFEQAVRSRSRKGWFRHKMSRKQLVGTTIMSVGAGRW